jgi:hypothetical protein
VTADPHANSSTNVPLIGKTRSFGPMVRRVRRRTVGIWLVLCIIGIVPTVLGWPAGVQALGMGLWLPGGGFLAAGGWWVLAFLAVVGVFGISMAAWLFTGNVVAPVVVWLGSAALATLAVDGRLSSWGPASVVGVTVLGCLAGFAASQRKERTRAARGRRRNADMPTSFTQFRAASSPAPHPSKRELSAHDLAALRRVLDLTLQPVGELAGFDMIYPRFQPAALRYQLNKLQHALSVVQCQYTPNFHGYLSEAQRFTIDSLVLPQVCGYWVLESLWGHLRWHPDPIDTKDNIMMTGWSGHCIGTYTANTGDKRYGQPDALAFRPFKRNPTKVYRHSHHDFIASLRQNWAKAPYSLYPCEPNFTYTVCNFYGYSAAATYDRAYGTEHSAEVYDALHRGVHSEFELADGELQPVLSDWTGLTLIFKPTLVSAVSNVPLMNAFEPELAERTWATTRHERIEIVDGRLEIGRLKAQDKVDVGNYRAGSAAFTLAWVAAAAHEMGDDGIAHAAIGEIDATHTRVDSPVLLAYEGVSALVSADIVLARILRRNYWRDTVVSGPGQAALSGPLLTDCRYPDVLVARALSPDGISLNLVLRPGANPGSLQTLALGRLRPGGRYLVTSAEQSEVVADAAGSAQILIRIECRTEVTLRPG